MLNDASQFNRHIKIDPVTGDVSEQILDKVDAKAAKDLMQVTRMIEDMTRSLYNIQKADALQKQQLEKERLAIEKERLELEKERLALRNQMSADGEDNYGIVIMPEVKDE